MPQRFLRPGIRNSARWNAVPFDAQSLYVRLLTLVDDFGRYDGRASVIWGECFAVWNEQNPSKAITLQQVTEMLQQLAAIGLVDIYDTDGKRVLQILQWQERIRDGCKERWPANPNSSNTRQLAATRSNLLPSPPSPSPSSPSSPSDKAYAPTKPKKPLSPERAAIATRFEQALGDEWRNDCPKWITRIKRNIGKCERVIADVEAQIKEGTVIKTPAALAEFNWGVFK